MLENIERITLDLWTVSQLVQAEFVLGGEVLEVEVALLPLDLF